MEQEIAEIATQATGMSNEVMLGIITLFSGVVALVGTIFGVKINKRSGEVETTANEGAVLHQDNALIQAGILNAVQTIIIKLDKMEGIDARVEALAKQHDELCILHQNPNSPFSTINLAKVIGEMDKTLEAVQKEVELSTGVCGDTAKALADLRLDLAKSGK